MADFPNRLNELRRARNLSQAKLGELVGSSAMQISRLETGKNDLSLSWMRRLAPHLGCNPGDLLLPDDNPLRMTPEEAAIIERYRMADEADRERIQRVADALLPYSAEPAAKKNAA